VAQLVEALRYKPEDRVYESRWLNPGADASSNRKAY